MADFSLFIGGSYAQRSPVQDNEEAINLTIEVSESEGAASKAMLVQTPGVQALQMVSAVGGRGMAEFGGRTFGVYGTTFYEFLTQTTSIARGTVAIDTNPVTISSNGDGGDQLFVTSGDKGYCYDLVANTLTEVLSSGATQGGFLSGYFISFNIANSQIRISDLFDGSVWDPTQFQGRTIGQDPWVGMWITPYGQIVLLGSQTGEVWSNTGAFPFPFEPDQTANSPEGLAATFSLCQAGKKTVWVATNSSGGYKVLASQGYDPQRISHHALETALASYGAAGIAGCVGQTFEEKGHDYVRLTFPIPGVTWQMDFTVGPKSWTKVGTWIPEQDRYTYFRPVFHAFAFGKHLMADRESGYLYWMDDQFYTDVDGRWLRWLRRSPSTTTPELYNVRYGRFGLIMQTGVGTGVSGYGQQPKITMRYSDDFGQTWSLSEEHSIGAIGDYGQEVYWDATGIGRGRVWEVTGSAPVPARITSAYQIRQVLKPKWQKGVS